MNTLCIHVFLWTSYYIIKVRCEYLYRPLFVSMGVPASFVLPWTNIHFMAIANSSMRVGVVWSCVAWDKRSKSKFYWSDNFSKPRLYKNKALLVMNTKLPQTCKKLLRNLFKLICIQIWTHNIETLRCNSYVRLRKCRYLQAVLYENFAMLRMKMSHSHSQPSILRGDNTISSKTNFV